MATHPDCARHVPFPGHPERPGRLGAAIEGGRLAGAEPLEVEVAPDRVRGAIERVHDPALAIRLRAACRQGPRIFDSADNPISEGSHDAACAAAASCLAAVDAVLAGRARYVWLPVRPPGHHARRDRAMGFCFFNNVALAAEELVARGCAPVAIVDFDVHHGNGTQEHFFSRDDVYYFSVHRYPFYPGSGTADEIGAGRGRGYTRNIPLAGGADDSTYCEAVAAGLSEIVTAITPQAWLLSAGFDAHASDPLGGMAVTDAGFARIGRLIRQASGERPVVAALEGGYDLEALRRSVQAFLGTLAGTAAS